MYCMWTWLITLSVVKQSSSSPAGSWSPVESVKLGLGSCYNNSRASQPSWNKVGWSTQVES